MRPRRPEAGDAAVETVLAVPVLVFLILVVVQAGIWYHTNQVLDAAAQEGVQAGRVDGATAADAEARASQFVTRISPSLGDTMSVDATRDDERTSIVVTAQAQPVIPGASFTVTGRASAPTERFREDR